MVHNLDKKDRYDLDSPIKAESILCAFADQLLDAIGIAENFALPSYLINCEKIVFTGMGASGIAGKLIKDLAIDSKKPIEIITGYKVPRWADKNTLVIALSHSGDTEETLSSFVDSYQSGTKLLAITTGGKLSALCRKYSAPCIEYNFNSEPKMAIAYLLMIPFVVMSKLGVTDFKQDYFSNTVILLKKYFDKINPFVHSATNPAKDLALKLFDKYIIVIGTNIIRSTAERFSHSLNEDSKNLASFAYTPEMNHNLVAGLDHPKKLSRNLHFVILESKFADQEVKQRENILCSILDRKKISYDRIFFGESFDRLCETILFINFCNFTSFYLAILNDENPLSAETVNYIKNEIRKD